jgi:uncharacterized protein
MIVLDTTVFAYAAGSDHPLREPCRHLMDAHAQGIVAATTTIEVVQEFAHVHARRQPRSAAVLRARELLVAVNLLETRVVDLNLGLELFEQYPALGAFDAVLAAVALNRGAEALVSADRGFGQVAGLNWIGPATTDLVRLLQQ